MSKIIETRKIENRDKILKNVKRISLESIFNLLLNQNLNFIKF